MSIGTEDTRNSDTNVCVTPLLGRMDVIIHARVNLRGTDLIHSVNQIQCGQEVNQMAPA